MATDHEFHELTVAAVVTETADARSFVLDVPEALVPTFGYTAGQFCTFRADIDGASVVRCYSMSSSPDVGDPLTVTVKRVRGGLMSNWMIDGLRGGEIIEVMRPAGRFVLQPRETPVLAFAGGSGITPVLSIVKTALATTSRPILLVYANRDVASVMFARELERLEHASDGRLRVHHSLDDAHGFLDVATCVELIGDETDADVYVCGPGPFMDTAEAGLALVGFPDERVFTERFVVPGEPARPADATDEVTESLVVRIGGRRHTVEYQAGDTVLETARRGGLAPPFSCEAGSCATCMAHLDDGAVRMRVNNALTPDEVAEGWILTCQSLPTSRTARVDYDA